MWTLIGKNMAEQNEHLDEVLTVQIAGSVHSTKWMWNVDIVARGREKDLFENNCMRKITDIYL